MFISCILFWLQGLAWITHQVLLPLLRNLDSIVYKKYTVVSLYIGGSGSVGNNWQSMLLRTLQTLAKCCSLHLAPKWHGIATLVSLFLYFIYFYFLLHSAFLFSFAPLPAYCAILTGWAPLLKVLLFALLGLALCFHFDGVTMR